MTRVRTRRTDRESTRARRVGDTVAIAGDYQYRALTEGPRPAVLARYEAVARPALPVPGPDDRVLDVGCGSGVVAAALADTPVRECVAVDGNPAAIAFAAVPSPVEPSVRARVG